VYNDIIPFSGYKAINLFGILFVRKGAKLTAIDINHECIHTKQGKELGWIVFYIMYLWFFVTIGSYKNVPFEKEAYANEENMNYTFERPRFNWKNYK
jgi:hypothetical protein